jgi:uncharacterized protein (DUF1697 family)
VAAQASYRDGVAKREPPAYAALLRAVNLGAHGKLSMPALKTALTELGLQDVTTYIQSGNVVFRSDRPQEKLAEAITRCIAGELGLATTVILRTASELRRIAGRNPFVDEEQQRSRLHVLFLESKPARGADKRLDPDRSPPDRYRVDGPEIYLHYPNGMGRSKLSAAYFERQLGVRATARNWNTVLKLVELTS